MAFPDGWGRRHVITIDAVEVGTGTHTDYVCLVTKDNLDSEVMGVGVNSALNGGGDVRFTSDEAGLTQLPCHIITFITNATPSSQNANIRVLVPSVSGSTDTDFYIWYNKSGETQPAVTDTFGRNATYPDHTVFAHLQENFNTSAGGYTNSTGGTDGTGISMTVQGADTPWGAQSANYNGDSTDAIGFPITAPSSGDNATMSAWGKVADLSADRGLVSLSEAGTNDLDYTILIWMDAGGAGDSWLGYTREASGGGAIIVGSTSDNDATTSWQRVDITVDSSGNVANLYLDGALKATAGANDFSNGVRPDRFQVGNWGDSVRPFLGDIAGAQFLLNVVKTAELIETEYNNESSPSTFAAAGTPSSPGISGTLSVTLTGDTSTSSGTVTSNVTGSASITLIDDTSAASGTVTQVITGTLAVTLQDDVSAAAGQVIISGTANIGLEDDTLTASGFVSQVFGTANVTLEDDTLASSGQVIFTGDASIILEDDSLAGVGIVSQSITGTASITLEGDTSTAAGTVLTNVTGSASITLSGDMLSASGLVSVGALAECTLVDRVGTPLPNLIQLSWAWFDNADPSNFVSPTDKGNAETTDAAGLIEVAMPNSSLSSGQTGTLTIRSNDGLLLGSYNLNVL